jgi:hypothetical protein
LNVKNKIIVAGICLVLFSTLYSAAFAQKGRNAAAAKAAPTLLSSLPQSDALSLVNVKTLLDQALPKMLAENPGKLAETNAEIEKFKTSTGINPRSFDQLALGLRYTYPQPGISKIESVVLARGTFDTAAIVAAGRVAANGQYREEKYQGRSIYIFTLNRQLKVFGLFNMKVNDLAVTALNKDVLALGSLGTVKTAIDAGKRRAMNQELIALATRDPNAAIGFGGNVTPELLKTINVPNDAIMKDVSMIRQVYGTVGVTEKDVEMFMAARTMNPESAKSLSQTMEGLKQLGAFMVARLPAPKGTVARSALDNLKITSEGNELQIRTAVSQADIAPFMRGE